MSEETNTQNDYLKEVLAQNVNVMRELSRTRGSDAPNSIDYRVTGFWRFRTVVVPPHVYAVHTRRGYAEPLEIGLGISFSFDPYRDSFLLIPAVVQTLIIDARCICRERQGLSVQAYVQWMVDDIGMAYRKLDFSDRADPMRIVNVQLREQAKAAIQDKVATMSLDDVLSDKQPIIEELTNRLRQVTEGRADQGPQSGLGLKIVTVQIREAVVRSSKLWDNLQLPYRADQERVARLAEIAAHEAITACDLAARSAAESAALSAEGDVSRRRDDLQREQYDREKSEAERRLRLQEERERLAIGERTETERTMRNQELALQLEAVERVRRKTQADVEATVEQMRLEAAQAELELAKVDNENAVNEMRDKAAEIINAREIAYVERQQNIQNNLSEERVRAMLIEKLPEIAKVMPAPKEMKVFSIESGASGGAATPLLGFLATALEMIEKKTSTPAPPTRRDL